MSLRTPDPSGYYLCILMDVARAVQGVELGKTVAVDLDGLPDDVRRLRAALDLAQAKLTLRRTGAQR